MGTSLSPSLPWSFAVCWYWAELAGLGVGHLQRIEGRAFDSKQRPHSPTKAPGVQCWWSGRESLLPCGFTILPFSGL